MVKKKKKKEEKGNDTCRIQAKDTRGSVSWDPQLGALHVLCQRTSTSDSFRAIATGYVSSFRCTNVTYTYKHTHMYIYIYIK